MARLVTLFRMVRSRPLRRIFGLAITAMLALPAYAQTGKPAAAEPLTQVYLIRGFLGVFSTGFDKMSLELGKKGIRTEVYGHMSASSVHAKIVRQMAATKGKRRKLVIVGHSFGGNAALSVAAQLHNDGIPVELVITVDPTRSGPLSSNVKRYRNYYFPGNGLGQQLGAPAKPSKRIVNVNMRERADVAGIGDDHWTVTNNAAIYGEILTTVFKAVR